MTELAKHAGQKRRLFGSGRQHGPLRCDHAPAPSDAGGRGRAVAPAASRGRACLGLAPLPRFQSPVPACLVISSEPHVDRGCDSVPGPIRGHILTLFTCNP